MDGWQPVLVTDTTADPARPVGVDGTPAWWSVDETAEMCARHVDALAADVERLARDVLGQVDELGAGNVVDACRRAFGLHGSLRRLAGQLGELHTVLDELAHDARFGGAR